MRRKRLNIMTNVSVRQISNRTTTPQIGLTAVSCLLEMHSRVNCNTGMLWSLSCLQHPCGVLLYLHAAAFQQHTRRYRMTVRVFWTNRPAHSGISACARPTGMLGPVVCPRPIAPASAAP